MNLWHMAFDAWNAIDREGGGSLTRDQQIAQAQTLALLAIGQELSAIHQHGVNPDFSSTG